MNELKGNPAYKRVMIIDDNEVDRYIAARNIKKYGFAKEVILQESAKVALDYLRSFENTPGDLPHLIFLDIRMPEIDGFGFLEEYGKLSETIKRNCIIIMLSTSLDPYDHERAKNNKYVNLFLNKPLSKEKLDEIGFKAREAEILIHKVR